LKTYQTTCPFCSGVSFVSAYEKDYNTWKAGTLIQVAMPYLNASQRELLMTGICCWDDVFGDDE
jgi:hypothetical protein